MQSKGQTGVQGQSQHGRSNNSQQKLYQQSKKHVPQTQPDDDEMLRSVLTQVARGESAPRVMGNYQHGIKMNNAGNSRNQYERYASSQSRPHQQYGGQMYQAYSGQRTRQDMGYSQAGKGHQRGGFGLLGPQPEHVRGRKTLVLDLDETLVHSQFKAIPKPDYIIPVDIENRIQEIFVLRRPGAQYFIQQMAQYYEVVIFTASLSKYADPLMDQMDPNRHCTKRLFREHCSYVGGVFTKDMSMLGRNMKDVIIIDNSPTSFMLQPECGLPILTWYDEMDDRVLYEYMPMLVEMSKINDVREAITGFVRNNTINMSMAMAVCEDIRKREQQEAEMRKMEAEASAARQQRELLAKQQKIQKAQEKAAGGQPQDAAKQGGSLGKVNPEAGTSGGALADQRSAEKNGITGHLVSEQETKVHTQGAVGSDKDKKSTAKVKVEHGQQVAANQGSAEGAPQQTAGSKKRPLINSWIQQIHQDHQNGADQDKSRQVVKSNPRSSSNNIPPNNLQISTSPKSFQQPNLQNEHHAQSQKAASRNQSQKINSSLQENGKQSHVTNITNIICNFNFASPNGENGQQKVQLNSPQNTNGHTNGHTNGQATTGSSANGGQLQNSATGSRLQQQILQKNQDGKSGGGGGHRHGSPGKHGVTGGASGAHGGYSASTKVIGASDSTAQQKNANSYTQHGGSQVRKALTSNMQQVNIYNQAAIDEQQAQLNNKKRPNTGSTNPFRQNMQKKQASQAIPGSTSLLQRDGYHQTGAANSAVAYATAGNQGNSVGGSKTRDGQQTQTIEHQNKDQIMVVLDKQNRGGGSQKKQDFVVQKSQSGQNTAQNSGIGSSGKIIQMTSQQAAQQQKALKSKLSVGMQKANPFLTNKVLPIQLNHANSSAPANQTKHRSLNQFNGQSPIVGNITLAKNQFIKHQGGTASGSGGNSGDHHHRGALTPGANTSAAEHRYAHGGSETGIGAHQTTSESPNMFAFQPAASLNNNSNHDMHHQHHGHGHGHGHGGHGHGGGKKQRTSSQNVNIRSYSQNQSSRQGISNILAQQSQASQGARGNNSMLQTYNLQLNTKVGPPPNVPVGAKSVQNSQSAGHSQILQSESPQLTMPAGVNDNTGGNHGRVGEQNHSALVEKYHGFINKKVNELSMQQQSQGRHGGGANSRSLSQSNTGQIIKKMRSSQNQGLQSTSAVAHHNSFFLNDSSVGGATSPSGHGGGHHPGSVKNQTGAGGTPNNGIFPHNVPSMQQQQNTYGRNLLIVSQHPTSPVSAYKAVSPKIHHGSQAQRKRTQSQNQATFLQSTSTAAQSLTGATSPSSRTGQGSGRTSQGQRNPQRMLIIGNNSQDQQNQLYMADRLTPKQVIQQDGGQIMSYNKKLMQQQMADMEGRTSKGHHGQHKKQGSNPFNKTVGAPGAASGGPSAKGLDSFSLQQHNSFVNQPHQLLVSPTHFGSGAAADADHHDQAAISALYPTSQSPLSYKQMQNAKRHKRAISNIPQMPANPSSLTASAAIGRTSANGNLANGGQNAAAFAKQTTSTSPSPSHQQTGFK